MVCICGMCCVTKLGYYSYCGCPGTSWLQDPGGIAFLACLAFSKFKMKYYVLKKGTKRFPGSTQSPQNWKIGFEQNNKKLNENQI